MTPARILRDLADDLLQQRENLSTRHLAREQEIITAATKFFAEYGRASITFGNCALALRMGASALRRYFTDLDALFMQVLLRHLTSVTNAICLIKFDDPAVHAARRAAYRAAISGPLGGLSPVHRLLTEQRFALPADLLAQVQAMRDSIALLLDPHQPDLALLLTEQPDMTAHQIEAMLAAGRASDPGLAAISPQITALPAGGAPREPADHATCPPRPRPLAPPRAAPPRAAPPLGAPPLAAPPLAAPPLAAPARVAAKAPASKDRGPRAIAAAAAGCPRARPDAGPPAQMPPAPARRTGEAVTAPEARGAPPGQPPQHRPGAPPLAARFWPERALRAAALRPPARAGP